MPSFDTRAIVAASIILLSVAACADNVTQGNGGTQATSGANAPASNAGRSDATPPTLDIQSTDGIASVFSGPASPPAGATYFTLTITGAGFPAGETHQSRLVGVGPGGNKFSMSSGIGPVPSDGSFREVYSASCPSGMSEVYSVVQTGAWTTESKHITPAC